MLVILIAVILLILFFSYFVRISFGPKDTSITTDETTTEQEKTELEYLTEQAKYKSLEAFAQFALLKPRPYKIDGEFDDELLDRQGMEYRKFDSGTSTLQSIDINENNWKPEQCYDACEMNYSCTGWELKQNTKDQTCKLYELDNPKTGKSDNKTSGIIQRKSTNWLYDDLSRMPDDAVFFESVAKIVKIIKMSNSELNERADTILSNSLNIKYCFESDVTQQSKLDGKELSEDHEYRKMRELVLNIFEDAAGFFLFKSQMTKQNVALLLELLIIIGSLKDEGILSSKFTCKYEKAEKKFKNIAETYQDLQAKFDGFDVNASQAISLEEWIDAKKSSDDWDDETCENQTELVEKYTTEFAEIDTDGDGFITFQEYLDFKLESSDLPDSKNLDKDCCDA